MKLLQKLSEGLPVNMTEPVKEKPRKKVYSKWAKMARDSEKEMGKAPKKNPDKPYV